MSRNKRCPMCRKFRKLTTHHVVPRRLCLENFSERVVRVCRKCHDDIERQIQEAEYRLLRKNLQIYFRVVKEIL